MLKEGKIIYFNKFIKQIIIFKLNMYLTKNHFTELKEFI